MEIKPAQKSEAESLQSLVRSVYDQAVSQLYSEEGNQEFYKYITGPAIQKRLAEGHWMLKAERDGKLVGLIEIRNNDHVSLLFIDSACQRQGIGKQLLAAAIARVHQLNPEVGKLTVHSSPNSVGAYEKLGFRTTSGEKEVNGIRFTSMEKPIG